MQTQFDSIPASFESDFERVSHCSSDHPASTKEVEIKYISHHVGVSHKQACSDLERIGECITEALQFLTQNKVGEAVGEILCIHLQRAYQLITEAIQSEVQRNTSLCVLITQVTGRLESEPNIVKTESGQDAMTTTGIKDEAMEGYAVADAINGDGGTDAAQDGCHGEGGDVRTAISKIKEEVEDNYDDDEDDATDDSDADGGADAFMEQSTPSPDEDINTLEHEESDVAPVLSTELNNKLNGDEGKLARAFDCPSTPLQGLEPLSAAPESQETKLILSAISGLSRMMTDTMARYMQRVDERFDGVEARLHSFEKRLPRSTEDEEDVPRKKRRVQNPKLAEAVRRLHNSKNTPLRYNPEEGAVGDVRSSRDDMRSDLKTLQEQVAAMQQQTSTRTQTPHRVPLELSARVRRTHRRLREELQWRLGPQYSFRSPHNEEVTKAIIQAIEDSGESWGPDLLRRACNRFYENLKSQKRLNLAGRIDEVKRRKKLTSRRERLFKQRLLVAQDVLDEDDLEYLRGADASLVSDEESGEEDKGTLVVLSPRWRSARLTRVLHRCQQALDVKGRTSSNPASLRRRRRVTERGRFSSRDPPAAAEKAIYVEA
ncbi:uncharacterized protein LOC134450174 [Engraulis encrasicolus]|uniref:uncharacterized protein LOC134450174 n=1 Tax=Engraulis encrasicolus TaxID=184585 RepID=UPI002FCFB50F